MVDGTGTTYSYDLNARHTSITTENTSATIFGAGASTPIVYNKYDGMDERCVLLEL